MDDALLCFEQRSKEEVISSLIYGKRNVVTITNRPDSTLVKRRIALTVTISSLSTVLIIKNTFWTAISSVDSIVVSDTFTVNPDSTVPYLKVVYVSKEEQIWPLEKTTIKLGSLLSTVLDGALTVSIVSKGIISLTKHCEVRESSSTSADRPTGIIQIRGTNRMLTIPSIQHTVNPKERP